jgi:D-tyrosyl-tRNA(Tyr) deacylase
LSNDIETIRYLIMRAVIQRVKESSVKVDSKITGKIGKGLLVLLGVAENDSPGDADYLSEKIINLRIFEDENGKMNRSLLETCGEMLVVSQFTLLGNCKKGRRPSFVNAAGPEKANELYEYFVKKIRDKGISVETGQFRTMMDVSLINEGPVTLIVESR